MNVNELKTYAAEYAARRRGENLSPDTVTAIESSARVLVSALEEAKKNEITPDAIRVARDALAAKNKPSTVRLRMTVWHTMFERAEKEGRIDGNPVLPEDMPIVKQDEQTLLTENEIERLLSEDIEHMTPKRLETAVIVKFLLGTGLRRGELIKVRLCDVDLDAGTVAVIKGKGGKNRLAPLPVPAADAVRLYLASGQRPAWAKPSAPLFGVESNGEWKPMIGESVRKRVRTYILDRTGKELHPHSMRHAAASLWDDLGVDMRDVQLALGHSSIKTTERVYVTVLNKGKSAAKINEKMARMAASK